MKINEKKVKEYASKIWNDTEDHVFKFIALSRMCDIPDEVTRKCLNEMIDTGFKVDTELTEEKQHETTN